MKLQHTPRKRRLTVLTSLIVLLALLLAGCNNAEHPTEPTPEATTETTLPTETTEATDVTEATTEPTETAPPIEETTQPTEYIPESVSFETALESNDLRTQREWFFDFARQYRLDYLPEFTQEDGIPTDTHQILNWCDTINDGTGSDGLILTTDYVEETVLTYFGKEFGQHQSHFKSWEYDPDQGTYTRWIEGGRDNQFYLLDSLEDNGDGSYTVHAALYTPKNGGYMEEEHVLIIRSILMNNTEEHATLEFPFYGSTVELKPIADFYLTFRMNSETALPLFEAFTVTMIDDGYSWW